MKVSYKGCPTIDLASRAWGVLVLVEGILLLYRGNYGLSSRRDFGYKAEKSEDIADYVRRFESGFETW